MAIKHIDVAKIPLYVAGQRWIDRYVAVMGDNEWLAKKTDRNRRLREHNKYLMENVPELFDSRTPRHVVLDLGPGPGELLEIARRLGYDPVGVDAEIGKYGMGDDYLEVSRLMTSRQRLNVKYAGALKWLASPESDAFNSSCSFVNSRGSIEQILHQSMDGIDHDVHQDCSKLIWQETEETIEIIESFILRLSRLVIPGGWLLIHSNGTGSEENMEWYNRVILKAGVEANLQLDKHTPPRLHRWVRK